MKHGYVEYWRHPHYDVKKKEGIWAISHGKVESGPLLENFLIFFEEFVLEAGHSFMPEGARMFVSHISTQGYFCLTFVSHWIYKTMGWDSFCHLKKTALFSKHPPSQVMYFQTRSPSSYISNVQSLTSVQHVPLYRHKLSVFCIYFHQKS